MKSFYELLRISIGVQDDFSHAPTPAEWTQLFEHAVRQSLVGLCFAGLNRLKADSENGLKQLNIPEIQYLVWLGMAADIQQKNDLMDCRCAEIYEMFLLDGLHSCILKGQGITRSYNEGLRPFRQSGDIDIWVKGERNQVLEYVQQKSVTNRVTKLHVAMEMFNDTIVEVHFLPSYLRCPWNNKRLQRWFSKYNQFDGFVMDKGFCTPSDEFNLVYLPLHIFRHLLCEGVGMRQLLDYYFVLNQNEDNEIRKSSYEVLKSFGLCQFVGALMWINGELFGLVKDKMVCEPVEKLGRIILSEIESAGNFGQYDNRRLLNETTLQRFYRTSMKNLIYLRYFPEEVLCTPIYRIWHRCWQIAHGYHE